MKNKLTSTSARNWIEFFQDRGISSDLISIYVPYIENLTKNNLPIIFEFEHLSHLLGINKFELGKIVNSPENYYREFSIPKRSGGKRNIESPYPSLLSCQRWIYLNILLKINAHDNAHGFCPGKSIITNASPHLNKKCLLKMDFENFFPSIPINWVINYFNKIGYAKNVSFYLASLCCFEGRLSQGAATSPYLSNILLISLDDRLKKVSESYHLSYSRYADDISFSGDYIPHNIIKTITNIVESYGLKINKRKTKLQTKTGKKIITGLSVSGENLTLPRETRRSIKKDIFYMRKYGFLSHISKLKINNPKYIYSLEGKLIFWRQVEPRNAFVKESLAYLSEIKNL